MRLPALRGGEPEWGAEAEFTRALVEASRSRKSWRERLQWIRDRFSDSAFAPTPGQLATVAVYLRFLATGELRCQEDGRHYRPKHHAEAALQIETALERLSTPETAWIVRRIYPYLPSWNEEFRRSEPLTRIRDIAHRNDIPSELKQEIKHRLQNKLHRCAGPEDLLTAEEILGRITAAGAGYPPAFVQEFEVFHGELQEFFNATALEARLRALARSFDAAVVEAVSGFLALKAEGPVSDGQLLDLLERLTALRQLFAEKGDQESPQRRSQLRLADIGLEDYAFALLSECSNRLQDLAGPGAWAGLLRAGGGPRQPPAEPDRARGVRRSSVGGHRLGRELSRSGSLPPAAARGNALPRPPPGRDLHRPDQPPLPAAGGGTGPARWRSRNGRSRSSARETSAATSSFNYPGSWTRVYKCCGRPCGCLRGKRSSRARPPGHWPMRRRSRKSRGRRGRSCSCWSRPTATRTSRRAWPASRWATPCPFSPTWACAPAGTPPVRRVRGAGTPQGL